MEVATQSKYAISLLPAESVSSLTSGLKVRSETQFDELVLTVEKSDYRTLCERLFAGGFDFPSSMTGVDMEWGLGVVLHVQQLESKRKVAVRVYLPYDAPSLPTVSDLWGGVDWHEREAYDLVGITFAGHHDHRRILLEDHWTIHPLQRKYNTRGYVIPTWSAKAWPSPAPHEEGYVAFGAAVAPVAHAATVTKPIASAASEAAPVTTSSETVAPAAVLSDAVPTISSDAPAPEAPKKAAKKWVPKTVDAAPSSEAVVAPQPTVEASSAAETPVSSAVEVPVSSAAETPAVSAAETATSSAAEVAVPSEPAAEAPTTEVKPRSPKIKRWEPNG